ncbi:hypothetical protein [Chitinophaga terrae (ex Kim and Jung 2007)]|nr:hypothetical protein [Chitinophaga terrae (ex Kim and Jung 2007)]MDQ0105113.1 hypothetical protein [Chitinophaga terrae (ex Kim and Jung 2007)]
MNKLKGSEGDDFLGMSISNNPTDLILLCFDALTPNANTDK